MSRRLFDAEPDPQGTPSSDPSPERSPAAGPPPVGDHAPLAERMRPRTLAEMVGQDHLLGADGPLPRLLCSGEVSSMIFWGPPGTGKTTLAFLLAAKAELPFRSFSAVLSGIREVRSAMQEAEVVRRTQGRPTLLFVDEIHRFNKAQQDAFLPFVERGDIVLIGATTENPSFEVIGPLLSRLTVHVLKELNEDDLVRLLQRALDDSARGLAARRLQIRAEQLQAMARFASGDARRALVVLENCARQCDVGDALPDQALANVLEGRTLLYDKHGESHFDLISALHKSVRSSDPDAALYWLARMFKSGEDPAYVARRLVRMASEDIGLADPGALRLAVAAQQAWHFLGSPEGELALAELAVYLAVAPKSNAVYTAYGEVMALLNRETAHPVPMQLRNAPTRLMKDLGWAKGQKYAHQEKDALTEMQCLPDALAGTHFYRPTAFGVEGRIRERLQQIRAEVQHRRQQDAADHGPADDDRTDHGPADDGHTHNPS